MGSVAYQINPVLMGGLVKEITADFVKIHLHGRLGVLEVPRSMIIGETKIEIGHELQFYFSYINIVEDVFDYDYSDINVYHSVRPSLINGKLIEVNDTAGKVEIANGLGTVAVPRRWFFTPLSLEVGQEVEFYLSCMEVIGKRELPATFI